VSPLVERVRSAVADEVGEVRVTVRSAARHVVVGELAISFVVLAIGLMPLPRSLLSPSHVAATAAGACWAALLVPARRR
jgi:hypothetical protein